MTLFSLLSIVLLGPVLVGIAPLVISRFRRPRSLGAEILAWRIVLLAIPMLPVAALMLPSIDTGDPFPFVSPESLGMTIDATNPWTSDLAIGLYVVGIIVTCLAVSALRLRALARTVAARRVLSTQCTPLELRTGATGPVVISTSSLVASPATLGTWLPQILLPEDAAAWPARRREAAVAHEMAHVEQRDDLWNLVALTVVALAWFHPLAWFARTRHARIIELVADARAAASFNDSAEYADELLAIARNSMSDSHPVPAMTGSRLEGRVDALLGPRPILDVPIAIRVAMLIIAIVIGAGVSLSGATPVPPRVDDLRVSIDIESPRRVSGTFDQHRIRDSARERLRELGRSLPTR